VVTVCSVCQCRAYCSRKCQIADWRLGHKFWCNKSGERSVDYEIRKSHDRGLGVFALRPFAVGDTIMAERSLMKTDLNVPSVRSAILDLMPHDTEDIEAKFSLNSIGIGASSNECHIFLNMSRVNHHCTGNADHYYIAEHGVKILTACRAIQAGEEITFSYINFMTHPQYYPYLEKKWKFVCNCSACADGSVFYKLMQLQPLDQKITQLGRARQFDEALAVGREMLQIYDALQASPLLYMRTYYDMFQLTVTRTCTLKMAQEYIDKAYSTAVMVFGDRDIREVRRFKVIKEDIKKYNAYLLAERTEK